VTGPLKVELRGTNGVVDRLRADALEATMVRGVRQREEARPPVAARAAPSSRGTRGGRAGAPKAKPSAAPWVLRASDMSLSFAAGDVSSFEASGGVSVESEDATVRGDILTYDATSRRLTVRMRGPQTATAVLGRGDTRNVVRSPEISVTLGDDGPGTVRARGPVNATLHRVDPKAPGKPQRYEVRARGAVEADATRIVTLDAEVRSYERSGDTGAWDLAWTLWSDRVTVVGRSLLGGEAPEIARLLAEGPKTALVSGQGENRVAVWADRFELDTATNRATVTGTAERLAQGRMGPEDGPQTATEFPRAVVDVTTGKISWDGPRIVIPREDR
jgi:hypothetical protein